MVCSICKKKVTDSGHIIYHNHDYYSNEEFEIVYCISQEMAATVIPDPKIFDVAKYYPEIYYGSNNQRFNIFIEYAIVFFRKLRANFIQRVSQKKTGSVLDIGCGRGIMLSILKNRGWKVTGTEYTDMSSRASRENLGNDIIISKNILNENLRENFDVITLFHVLEHVPDPDAYFGLFAEKLTKDKNSILIIEVPNISSWQFKIAKGSWIYLEAPRHLFHFSGKALENLAGKHGFSVSYKSTFSLEFGYFGMIESLFNTIIPSKNSLFHLLRKDTTRSTYNARSVFLKFSILILLIPVTILSIVLETMAVLSGKGGVVRVVFKKKDLGY